MRPLALHAIALALSLRGLLGAQNPPQLPAGFVVEEIGSNWGVPVGLCFIDGARLLVADKMGGLWYVVNKVKRNEVIALDGEVISNGDRGLLGVAIDPRFDENGFIYLLLVVDPDGDGNDLEQETFSRLVRYTTYTDPSGNLLADPASRFTLLGASWSEGIPALYLSHSVGQLAFMSDGSLLVSHGEGAHWDLIDVGGHDPNGFGPGKFSTDQDIGVFRSQAKYSLAGKILRLDPSTGLGLPDNPFYTGDPGAPASRVWALGLRNPYRFALVPGTGPREALFACDDGNAKWEELDLCRGGENFGWPCNEGSPPLTVYRNNDVFGYCAAAEGAVTVPWLAWNHTNPGTLGFTGNSVTGACVYTGTSYPAIYRGALFFCDYGQSWMKVATLDASLNRTALLAFGSNMDRPIDIEREPLSGDLVYISLGGRNRVMRLRYAPSNRPPEAVASATPPWGHAPLTVHLSSAGSFDPEGDPLEYSWDLGDGTSSNEPEVTKVYTGSQIYTVVLTVTDGLGNQDSEELLVNSANTPPTITVIRSPTSGATYEQGEPLSLACFAMDAEDNLAGIPLQAEWSFDLIHDHHVHPAWASVSGLFGSWIPEAHGEGSHSLLVHVTVKDSQGLTDTQTRMLYDRDATPLPHVVSVSDARTYLGVPVTVRAHVDYAIPPESPRATLTFDWGDGAQDVFPDVEHQVDQSAAHNYATLGSYNLRIVAMAGALSNEEAIAIQVAPPAIGVSVFVPLLAEGNVSWQEQEAIADELVMRFGPRVTVFHWDEQAELVHWMQAHMEDEFRDLLVVLDFAPLQVFAGEVEGSLAEHWIENGNGIVWTGAAPFAASIAEDGSTRTWGPRAADSVLDAAAEGVCQGVGAERKTVMARRFLPSLSKTTASNAVRLDRLGAEWSALRVFARGEDHDSDAVELGHASGGLYAQFYCVSGGALPRAPVLVEFLRLLLHKKVLPMRW